VENVRRADQEVRDEQTVRPKLCMNDIPLLIAFIKAFIDFVVQCQMTQGLDCQRRK
jgi:hypothetical protein